MSVPKIRLPAEIQTPRVGDDFISGQEDGTQNASTGLSC